MYKNNKKLKEIFEKRYRQEFLLHIGMNDYRVYHYPDGLLTNSTEIIIPKIKFAYQSEQETSDGLYKTLIDEHPERFL